MAGLAEIVKLIQRKGLKADLPLLSEGELGFATDTEEIFIGSATGNFLLPIASDIQSGLKTVDTSITNGNIMINGIELQVYNDSSLMTALAGKANTTHRHSLSDLNDIDLTGNENGYILVYNFDTSIFEVKPIPKHTHTTDDITDINNTNKTNGNVLTWDSTENKFISKPLTSSTGSSANIYLIELERWGIQLGIPTKPYVVADYNKANTNITGINNALKWANNNSYNYVVFPRGEYSLCYPNPI